MTVWKKNKSFSKKVDLEQHIMSRMIDQKEVQRVRCIECFKGLKSKRYLEDHVKGNISLALGKPVMTVGQSSKRRNVYTVLNIKRKRMITLCKDSKI